MPRITVIGAGVCGLLAATLLAKRGHQVTVLERDAAEPLESAEASWDAWERRGVGQFRLLHYLQPRFRQEIEAELPEIAREMERLGAVTYGIERLPTAFTGGERPGDERFAALTGRRPMIETAIARVATSTPGVLIRRGVAVTALVRGADVRPGTAHVTGVRLESGEVVDSELVVDAAGRRSAIPRLLEEAGTRPAVDEQEEIGLVYYGRHFRSSDGTVPDVAGPILASCGSFSTLTLPADNGTWGLGLLAAGTDKALRAMKEVDVWERVWRLVPHVEHWLDGTQLAEGVAVMANLPDRIRALVVDGQPVATGVTVVADSWSCTNPSVGRGISIGLLHALCLCRTLDETGIDDPFEFAVRFAASTSRDVEPWYRATAEMDRDRLAEMERVREGVAEPTEVPPGVAIRNAFVNGAWHDPDVLRAMSAVGAMLNTPEEILGDEKLFEQVLRQADAPPFFVPPSRTEVLAVVG
jgi:2-polyprenyl-6-methoxyphenol hydroxylase-like FAD-dependent oxidoreductase